MKSKTKILEKAWKKALYNGFKPVDTKHLIVTDKLTGERFGYETWIYDHDFARAIWGDGPNCAYCGEPPHNMHRSKCIEGSNIWPYLWEYHLQQMVIAADPVEYLEIHLYSPETFKSL